MKRTYVGELIKLIDTDVLLKGWVYKILSFGKLTFVFLRDKTGIAQLVVEDEELIKDIRLETALEVEGKVVKNNKAPSGLDVQVSKIKIVGKSYYDLLPFNIGEKKSDPLEMDLLKFI